MAKSNGFLQFPQQTPKQSIGETILSRPILLMKEHYNTYF